MPPVRLNWANSQAMLGERFRNGNPAFKAIPPRLGISRFVRILDKEVGGLALIPRPRGRVVKPPNSHLATRPLLPSGADGERDPLHVGPINETSNISAGVAASGRAPWRAAYCAK
jgi:hypothetical protein